MARDQESTIRTLRKRVTQLKAQLNAEKDARTDHIQKVRNTIDELGRELQNERKRRIDAEVRYEALLQEVSGDGGDEGSEGDSSVQVEETVSDEEGGEDGAAEDVEEGEAGE